MSVPQRKAISGILYEMGGLIQEILIIGIKLFLKLALSRFEKIFLLRLNAHVVHDHFCLCLYKRHLDDNLFTFGDIPHPQPKLKSQHKAEAVIVVPIVRRIVVPIRNTTVPCVVVPTTTAQHAVSTLRLSSVSIPTL